jgi:hypothetical protein
MDSARTFFFEVVFGGEAKDPSSGGRSVFVEVESHGMVQIPLFGPSGKTARQFAKDLAPEVAIQVIQKDLPHGFEPPYSVVQIDKLPKHLRNRPPKFQGSQFRAW